MTEAANDVRYRILENMCLAHTGEKHTLEQASENLSQILNDDVRKKDEEKIRRIRLIFLLFFSEGQCRSDLCR